MIKKYLTILADPPWQLSLSGKYKSRKNRRAVYLPYPTMTVHDICNMPIGDFADVGCHLWLWTTNQHMEDGFKVMQAWGFKYLAPIHWIKPSGLGNWFVHRTQTILFGYRDKCKFPLGRYKPNIIMPGTDPVRHSQKPTASYEYIESISPEPRLELFARSRRPGWDVWGNEVDSDVSIATCCRDGVTT